MRSDARGCTAGHRRYGDVEFPVGEQMPGPLPSLCELRVRSCWVVSAVALAGQTLQSTALVCAGTGSRQISYRVFALVCESQKGLGLVNWSFLEFRNI